MITVYKVSLFFSIIFIFIGILFKIMHWPWADSIRDIGYLIGLIFGSIGIYKIYQSKNLTKTNKVLWSFGLIFFGWIVGIIFYKKVIKPNNI